MTPPLSRITDIGRAIARAVEEMDYKLEELKIGSCGSPIETDARWLAITHDVGLR